MENLDAQIIAWFSHYVYQPELVYLGVTLLMLGGSFGLPIPEEVALVSVGMVAYMGSRPDLYPPPHPGAHCVNGYLAAFISFLAVIGSDTIVYSLGKVLGKKALNSPRFQRWISPEMMTKIQSWTKKYGIWASGIFRFTPALRFPGFLSCGIFDIPFWKFLAIDGTAALISVPTQVILVYLYGETILVYFKKFKIVIVGLVAICVVYLLAKKIYRHLKNKNARPRTA